jgi:hypothetical protein
MPCKEICSMIIECKKVKFYASYDEDAFFEYLAKIKSVITVNGKKDSIYLTVNNLTNEDLYNLVGLFKRYKIKMDQLNTLLDEPHKKLFHEYEKAYHINVYPSK